MLKEGCLAIINTHARTEEFRGLIVKVISIYSDNGNVYFTFITGTKAHMVGDRGFVEGYKLSSLASNRIASSCVLKSY